VLGLVVLKGGAKLTESSEAPVAIDDNTPLAQGEQEVEALGGQIRMKVDLKTGAGTIDMGLHGTAALSENHTTMMSHLEASKVSMAGLAHLLGSFTRMAGYNDRPVIDMTGLKGHYEIRLDVPLGEMMAELRARAAQASSGGAGASVPDAADPGTGLSALGGLRELGLKLEPRTATIAHLVVDRVEKTPTEN
jgi:uncharacterized protein (TIGR03435 family)